MRGALLLAVVAGCSTEPTDYTGRYVPGIAVCCGVAAVTMPDEPSPTPAPTPDTVPRPADCPDGCVGGVLGDGTVRLDCPTCDRDGDGDPNDTIRQQPTPGGGDTDAPLQDAPPASVAWRAGWAEARAEQARTGKPILVLLTFRDTGCPPCEVLKRKTLADDDVVRVVNRDWIPVQGFSEDWNCKRAPVVVGVRDGLPEGAVPPTITEPDPDPDAFLTELQDLHSETLKP